MSVTRERITISVHAPARPAESRSASYGATSTGAERTWLREHQNAGATTLAERISAGAHRSESGERLRITIVGAGPGSLDYITPAARRAVEDADLLVGAQRLLDLFPDAKAERIVLHARVEAALDAIAQAAGRNIVVLVTGDPGLMSLARPVVARFGRDACRVIPGVSSVQVAFARIAMDWHGATIVDAHGAKPDLLPQAALHLKSLAILLGCRAAAPWLSQIGELLEPSHHIVACRDLTLPTEHIAALPASELASLAGTPRTIVLLVHKELLP